jgi:hypothetical protein
MSTILFRFVAACGAAVAPLQWLGLPDARAQVIEPPYTQPDEVENLLLQYLAQRPGLRAVSINSVKCDETTCEVAIAGLELNPRDTDAYQGLFQDLFAAQWGDVRVLSGGMGSRETAPGARESLMSFEYQPLVDRSDDPRIAARQEAACAAAWRRQTTNPTPDSVVREYLAIAEQHVALAATELGREQAERIAAQTKGGPLIRECGLSPSPQ